MTRLFAISIAALTFAFSACEKHPLPGETLVTETHGSNGAETAEGHEKAAEGTAHAEKAQAEHKEEKGGAEKKS